MTDTPFVRPPFGTGHSSPSTSKPPSGAMSAESSVVASFSTPTRHVSARGQPSAARISCSESARFQHANCWMLPLKHL